MDPKIQKIVMVALGTVCAAIWLPQMMSGDDSSAQVDVAGQEPGAEMILGPEIDGEFDGIGGGAATASAADWGGTPESAIEEVGDPRENVGTLVERLEVFGAAAKSLDELASGWASSSSSARVTEGPFSGGHRAAIDASASDPLAEFLEENPFQGTIVMEEDAVAMFGPYSYRVGQDLLDGEAVIAAIERKRVSMSYRGLPVWLELPPLRVQARPTSGSGAMDLGAEAEGTVGDVGIDEAIGADAPHVDAN